MSEEAASEQQQPLFNIEKLYVKDLSLESPNAPSIFLERENPNIELQLNTQSHFMEEGLYEVTVTVTVTAKLPEKDKVMFLIEAKQAGIFQVRNLPPDELESVLAIICPNILYPYLREVVSNMAIHAGFTPVLLNPINFEALYQQQKQQLAQAQAATNTQH
ncbi:protein-export chaperone SecB [Candidatus Nitrotoga sp. AM1P]|uniref:protein-export chaperone SecB n=1 Tax=Candidatus Nitrotoga sp. AM1P TaxID=2559597 RepID=UPI0010B748B8|nr:protein-export chaperone SecB [Candidatus Nitrotoga sp. AM1P]BBJ23304.1 protein-export protein SecB [Candidatus Nitrotoga sp. AM1P]